MRVDATYRYEVEIRSDWSIKEHSWTSKDRPVVRVYFEDEKDIPFPPEKNLSDFLS